MLLFVDMDSSNEEGHPDLGSSLVSELNHLYYVQIIQSSPLIAKTLSARL